jgi:plasmid stabilization system protein ParE
MAFRVNITPAAEQQIEQSYLWYRERNPDFADRWFRGLMNAIERFKNSPSAVRWRWRTKYLRMNCVNYSMAKVKALFGSYSPSETK